jgi:hypothetical protein
MKLYVFAMVVFSVAGSAQVRLSAVLGTTHSHQRDLSIDLSSLFPILSKLALPSGSTPSSSHKPGVLRKQLL